MRQCCWESVSLETSDQDTSPERAERTHTRSAPSTSRRCQNTVESGTDKTSLCGLFPYLTALHPRVAPWVSMSSMVILTLKLAQSQMSLMDPDLKSVYCPSSVCESPWHPNHVVSHRYGELLGVLLTQFLTLEAASSFVIRCKDCVVVHVGILVVQLPVNHCGAMHCLLFRAGGCSERSFGTFPRAGEGFTIAEESDKLHFVNIVCVMMLASRVSCVNLSLVNDSLAKMSANCCVVLTDLFRVIGSKLMRSFT